MEVSIEAEVPYGMTLHYPGNVTEIVKDRKPFGPNMFGEWFYPVMANYNSTTDITTVVFDYWNNRERN